jgi:hypothetical protein
MFPSCVESYALYAKVLQETLDFEKADQMYLKVGQSTKIFKLYEIDIGTLHFVSVNHLKK